MKLTGTLVAAHGRHYRVRLDGLNSGETVDCFPRGKKSELACGDKVSIERLNATQGVIDSILPRRSLLYRSNDFRQKLIAANVTQIIIVVATEPSFSDELVSRCLVAAHNQDIAALIVLNKSDLSERLNRASEALTAFVALGYPLLTLSAHADVTALRERLHGHVSVLIGQSGMGKSTLINALLPEAAAPVREISSALDSGKHTTTHATLYALDAHSALIDSPGLQEFGLKHLSFDAIAQGFPELQPLLGQCRFRNCRHDKEPNCALHEALRAGAIHPRRYAVFRALCDEVA